LRFFGGGNELELQIEGLLTVMDGDFSEVFLGSSGFNYD
jgi:hypothetical protein